MCGDHKPQFRAEQHVVHATLDDHMAWRAKITEQFVEIGRLKTGHDVAVIERENQIRLKQLEAESFADPTHLPTWYVRNLARRHPLKLTITFNCKAREDGAFDSVAIISEID